MITTTSVLPAIEEATEEVIIIVVKRVIGKKISEEVIGLVEIEVAEVGSLGPLETIFVICLSLLGVR